MCLHFQSYPYFIQNRLNATHPNRSEEAIEGRGSNFNSTEAEKAFWAVSKPTPDRPPSSFSPTPSLKRAHLTSSPTPSDHQYSVETKNPMVTTSAYSEETDDCQYSIESGDTDKTEDFKVPLNR